MLNAHNVNFLQKEQYGFMSIMLLALFSTSADK